jgi:hypothetical protein
MNQRDPRVSVTPVVEEIINLKVYNNGGASFVQQTKVRPDVSASLQPDVSASLQPDVSANIIKIDVSAT